MISFEGPLVYLITEGRATDADFTGAHASICDSVRWAADLETVDFVQVREHRLSAQNLLRLTADLVAIAGERKLRILVNDRADIAYAAGASGVHLRSTSIPVDAVRAAFGKGFVIGASVHSLEEASGAARSGADFAVLAPVFETPAKSEPLGLDYLSSVCRELAPFPVIALGGIDQTNARAAIAAGAAGVGGIRSFNNLANLSQIVERINR
ncbi:MAG: thiamine phosphate synthase [Pyrinomonadaceae bacterium]